VTETSDGTVLLKCWGGCDTEDVLDSLGLTFRDLFPSRAVRLSGRRPRSHVPYAGGRGHDEPPTELSAEDRRRLEAYLTARPAPGYALRQLSVSLRLPVDAVRAAKPGYDEDVCCWLLPERDGDGDLVGIARRFWDGRKGAIPWSHRGLTILPYKKT